VTENGISQKNIVLFYPKLGWMDVFVLDLPLSVLYVAHECNKHGIDVRIVDQRVHGSNWQKAVTAAIDDDTLLVGFSVMSGAPILNALQASRHVRAKYPDKPIVWGGMHVSICPTSVLDNPLIDFIQCGLGSQSLYLLARHLYDGSVPLPDIPGLGWRENGAHRINPQSNQPSYCPLGELDLSGLDMKNYTRFNYGENVYSLFTSFGCPHQCRFCFAPIFWRETKGKRWFPYDTEDVINHVVDVIKKHDIGYISVLDENFFLDIKRAERIFRGIQDQGLHIRWGIRGARIDDLHRMDDDFLQLMIDVGVEQIMIGAESGSQRMLDLMKKGIKVEQTLEVNRKLARFPKIKPSYNFLSGIPGETIEDLYLSADLIVQLGDENPNASFSGMNQFIPFPGSELYDECVKGGYQEPRTLEEWALIDTHYNSMATPWNTPELEATLHSIQAALMFADKKTERELSGQGKRGPVLNLLFRTISLGARLYRPIARWRLRKRFFKFPIDYALIKLASQVLSKIRKL
jgi:radical SAM superfamily enzyme YgiQ (UPF0313 family)